MKKIIVVVDNVITTRVHKTVSESYPATLLCHKHVQVKKKQNEQEGGLQPGKIFWLRLITASAQCLRLL